MTLTTRLLVLVGLAVLPALAIAAYTEFDLRRTRAAEVRAEALRLFESAVGEVRRSVESVQRFGVTLVQVPAIRDAALNPETAETCRDLLVRLRNDYPGRIDVGVADVQGRLVCTSLGVRSYRPVLGSHFRRSMDTNSFVVGGYGASPAGTKYLTFAHPIRDDADRPAGALLLGLDLSALTSAFGDIGRSSQASVGLLDRDLVYVFRSPQTDPKAIGQPVTPEERSNLALVGKGVFEGRGRDGTRRVALINPVAISPDATAETPDFYLGVGLPRDSIFARIDDATSRAFLLLALSAALAVLAVLFVGRRFINAPVESLLQAARQWSVGDYRARVRLTDKGEFGRLGEALDRMAAETERRDGMLRENERALLARTGELEAVLSTVPAAVWFTYDPQVRHVLRNRYAADLMRLKDPTSASFAQNKGGELSHIRVLRNGEEVPPEGLPLQRAIRGEDVRDEEYVFVFSDGTRRVLLSSAASLTSPTGERLGAVSVGLDITDRKTAERHQRLLIHELNHRVKNTLATVQSLAMHTFRDDERSAGPRHAFEARLLALARAHDVLTRENWEGAELAEVAREAIAAYGTPGDGLFTVEGPPVLVAPRIALPLSMALQELATNAAKYGALSAPGGRVTVEWKVASVDGEKRLRLRWEERDGPPVTPPARRGFGSRLIERQVSAELGGRALIEYAPKGVVCTLEVPLPPETETENGRSLMVGE